MSPAGPSDAPDQRSDLELIGAINRGDQHAFEALYRRHRDWAWRVARRFTRDDTLASDVVQEAFLQLLGRFPGFRLTSKFSTFLYPLVRNLAVTEQRRSRRLAIGPLPPNLARPASGAVPLEADTPLQQALDGLAEGHREVLLMRAVDQMTIPEIALALGLPEGTVKSRLHNALEKLRSIPGLGAFFAEP